MPDFLLFVRKLFPLRSKNISSEEEKKKWFVGLCWATAEQLLCSTLTIVAQLWRKFSFEPESFNLRQAKRQV
jgi:hypothetical protein